MYKTKQPTPLTVTLIQFKLKRIHKLATLPQDYERAHKAEDELYREVLKAIADGADDPQALAKAALVSLSYDFPRHYA